MGGSQRASHGEGGEVLQGWQAFYSGRPDQRPDEEALRRTITALVALTGLTAIGEPIIHIDAERAAWGAIQLIAESHIAIDGKRTECAVTIFSCRSFDADACAETLRAELP